MSRRSPKEQLLLFGYILVLTLLYDVAATGVAGVPMQFILKDTLHLKPEQLSLLGLLTDVPLFVGFAFGFLRDRWSPWRMGDRGYFLLLPPLMALVSLPLAYGPFTYSKILIISLAQTVFGALLGAAMRGLMASLALAYGTSGRFSVLLLLIPRLIGMASSAIGGHLADPAHQHLAFLLSAALCLPMLGMAFWKPGIVLEHERAHAVRLVPEGTLAALNRLVRHRPVYLPAIITFLWAFAPGWGTPLFFYMTNTVRVSEEVYGNCGAVQGAGTLCAVLAYTVLCYKLRLRALLWWGTFFGVLGCPVFLLVHTRAQAYSVFFLAGASLGIALCAFNDLLFRCCPAHLEGAAVMFTSAMSAIAADTSDLFGAWLYEKGGFILAMVVSTLFTGLIFAVLPFVPQRLTAPREGEALRPTDSYG